MAYTNKYFNLVLVLVITVFISSYIPNGRTKYDRFKVRQFELLSIDTDRCISGIYGDISIAVNANGKKISGVYQYYDKWNKKYKSFTDINTFFFTGSFDTDTSVSIIAGWPKIQKIRGKIIFTNNKSIIVFLDQQPDGYNDVNFKSKLGVSMNFKQKKDWLEINLIKSQKAKLFNEADSSTARKGYLVKEDVVKTISLIKNGWVKIEYCQPGFLDQITRGWIRREVLYVKGEVLNSE